MYTHTLYLLWLELRVSTSPSLFLTELLHSKLWEMSLKLTMIQTQHFTFPSYTDYWHQLIVIHVPFFLFLVEHCYACSLF